MVCNKCHQDKPQHHFSFRKDLDKYRSICRSCSKGYKTNRKDWIEEITRLYNDGKKKCGNCNEIKPLSSFNKDKTTRTGRVSYCKSCLSEINRALREIRRLKTTAKRYNITEEEVVELQKTDNCEICGVCVSEYEKHIDHCHETGIVRGILCRNCNLGIGHLKDDLEILNKAVIYLNKHKNK